MGIDDAHVVLLSCDDEPDGGPAPYGMRMVEVPSRPGRADLEPVLADRDLRRVVVEGTDADLAAVLGRLLRAGRLDLELAYLPVAGPNSAAARVWGLPHGVAALDLALQGTARAAPLVRDDSGGVLVGRGEIRGVHGEAYCDGELVLRGAARRLVVTPWPAAPPIPPPASPEPAAAIAVPAPPGVAVRAGFRGTLPDGRLRAVAPTARTGQGAATGRALQIGCLPATLLHDGVPHPRPVQRWAWYRHVADWLLVRPSR